MRLWVAYLVLGFALSLIAVLTLAGCTSSDPTGPDVSFTNSPGAVANINTGNNGAVGTAPCGASTNTPQKGNGLVAGAGPDCSTNTVVPEPTPPETPAP